MNGKERGKRGLSPVIATVLLISLALVLVMIIFIWARTWIGEKIQKDLGGGAEAIETFCDDIDFNAEAELLNGGRINVNNIGNIPLYGVEVRKKGAGVIENIGIGIFDNGLPKGGGKGVFVDFGGDVGIGDELIVVPVILGEGETYKKPYTCAEDFAEIARVVA